MRVRGDRHASSIAPAAVAVRRATSIAHWICRVGPIAKMASLKRFLRCLNDEYAEATKIGFSIITAVVLLWQYLEAAEESRVARTLELAAFDLQSPYSQSRQKFLEIWYSPERLKKLREFVRLSSDTSADPKELNAAFSQVSREASLSISSSRITHLDIYNISNHYEKILSCADGGDCSWDTVCDLFREEISDFNVLYSDIIEENDKAWSKELSRSFSRFYKYCECRKRSLIGHFCRFDLT